MKKRQKEIFLDLIFISQTVMGILFAVFQIMKMQSSVEGLTVPVFLFNLIFISIVWIFSFSSHRANPSKVTIQILITYTIGLTVYGSILGMFLYRADTYWIAKDTITTLLVSIGAGIIVLIYRRKVMEPRPRAYMGVIFKAIYNTFWPIKAMV